MIKALLIEDDRKLAALLVEFLGQHGVEATIAADSAQALQHLGSSRFDILLLDLMLPGMDGLTLTRKIRERWNTPIIMVTARGDDADKIVGWNLARTTTWPSRSIRGSCWRASGPCCAGPNRPTCPASRPAGW